MSPPIGSHWAREFRDENGERPESILESDRWIEGYERVAETAATLLETRCVYVADREADIVSLMYRAAQLEHPADWLIRSKHNFEPDEWAAAYILNEKQPPKEVPTVNEVVRLIASLGGFLGRKRDGEPGIKTIWQGMEKVASFAAGMKFARQMVNTS